MIINTQVIPELVNLNKRKTMPKMTNKKPKSFISISDIFPSADLEPGYGLP